MTRYEQELRKLFDGSGLMDRPQYSGRVCVGELGKDLRVRAEFFSAHVADQYDAIRLTVLNRKEGVVDRTLLQFKDVWGKKPVPSNPNFRSGVMPHLWDDHGDVDWYVYHPSAADYDSLRQAIGSICPCFGSERRNGRRTARSWCLSVLRCGAMWKRTLNLPGRRPRRCSQTAISPSVRICCFRPSRTQNTRNRTKKSRRCPCGFWSPASSSMSTDPSGQMTCGSIFTAPVIWHSRDDGSEGHWPDAAPALRQEGAIRHWIRNVKSRPALSSGRTATFFISWASPAERCGSVACRRGQGDAKPYYGRRLSQL